MQMPGESILIVDESPVDLRLTKLLLVNAGYKVLAAASAEEALGMIRSYRPRLILSDTRLPGMDGFEFARHLKQNDSTSDIIVIAATSVSGERDEARVADAGFDGLVERPFDFGVLCQRIREFLDRGTVSGIVNAEPSLPNGTQVRAARQRFLEEGQAVTHQWLADYGAGLDYGDARWILEQWTGDAELLGLDYISRRSAELEVILRDRPFADGEFQQAIGDLARAFSSLCESPDVPIPNSILQSLAGKRIGMIDLTVAEQERVCATLKRVKAVAVPLAADGLPGGDAVRACDLVILDVNSPERDSAWFAGLEVLAARTPLVFVGERDRIAELDASAHRLASEYLIDSWASDEALARFSLAISRPPRQLPAPRRAADSGLIHARVLVVDDDPTIVAFVKAAIQSVGTECHTAADGQTALQLLRTLRFHAAVVDVNMPEMDGFALLSAIRSEKLPVRVMLLTSRQHEEDVLRGFMLGADEYVVKPFSPPELIARLKRLL
jgi:two-component system, cell cycle response regulator DivK